jgi:hypothetical protein
MKPTAMAVKIAARRLNTRRCFSFISAMLKVAVRSIKTTIKLIDMASARGVIMRVYFIQDYYSFGFIMIKA